MRRAARWLAPLFTLLFALAGCASLPARPPGGASPLVYDAEDVEEAERLVIAFPGLLNSVRMFDPTLEWRAEGAAIIRYRYPGLDGLAVDHRLTVEGARAEVRAFLDRRPDKPVALLGISAGGQIALEVAKAIPERHPRVVAISPATGFPRSIGAGLWGARQMVVVAVEETTLDMQSIWARIFPMMLFGEEGAEDPALQDRILEIFDPKKDKIFVPKPGMFDAQADDITWRRLRVDEALRRTPVLIIQGDVDPITSVEGARELAAELPKARLVEIEGHGHLLYLTDKDAVFEIARRFLLEDARPGG